ncbi:dihydroorotate dehydrogenase electron transfer subunit [Boudabousia marimammalium]|uniref:Dihydroorotate dehydrogenase B (NAD(+)), electron transfer subunit n=1 Tax=Boudabousia marimammalium TaxID=156892 RepID=A0A1Q5PSV0_9ACTO|nr:dihydroorotate dehydrogenase electron transfer subunit [Boudabousia marimammalium]OKL50525.1 hypothetical protein BM477_00705 [Boudabousia marimammalium]
MSCFKPAPVNLPVVSNRQIADSIWELVFTWNGSPVPPGTFVMVKPALAKDLPLGRPISVADMADDGSTLTIIYRVVGVGTAALSQLTPGTEVTVLGPLGQGFPLQIEGAEGDSADSRRALLVGGGVGIPPLYLLGRRLKELGWELSFQLGLRGEHEIFWADKYADLGTVHWATDDGSAGTHGTVAQIVLPETEAHPDAVHACGPLPMLRHVKERWMDTCPTFVSVEQRMACGVGACYACVIPNPQDPEHQHRICYDGPVFAAAEVTL